MANGGSTTTSTTPLEDLLVILRKDYSKLSARIRTLQHTRPPPFPSVNIRLHYPSLRDGQATIEDLVITLVSYLMHFSLPRSDINELRTDYGNISADEYEIRINKLIREAKKVFIKANKTTNRNGEGGELLLYLLTEWILDAPQLLAKMSLKTSPMMPVHGADGIHVRFCPHTKRLLFYWGESKLYKDVTAGIKAALKSAKESLMYEKVDYEFSLVRRHIDLSGLDEVAKSAILSYLDPLDENSNERANVITCLVAFDFAAYTAAKKLKEHESDDFLRAEIESILPSLSNDLAEYMKEFDLQDQAIEVFFVPIPAVQTFRNLFQAEIGWSE